MNNFKMNKDVYIDWEKLRELVDADLQKQIDEEVSTVRSIQDKYGKEGIIYLDSDSDSVSDSVSDSEHAFDELFKTPQLEECYCEHCNSENYLIKCKHLSNNNIGEYYVYPLNDRQEIYLCKECHIDLSKKILEQLTLEILTK